MKFTAKSLRWFLSLTVVVFCLGAQEGCDPKATAAKQLAEYEKKKAELEALHLQISSNLLAKAGEAGANVKAAGVGLGFATTAAGQAQAGQTNALASVTNGLAVATRFNDRAQGLLPAAPADVTAAHVKAAQDLLSLEKLRVAHAEGVLNERDRQIVNLESELRQLHQKEGQTKAAYEAAITKMKADYSEAAEKAALWDAEQRKSWWKKFFAWIFSTLGIGGIIALCVLCPAVLPILGSAMSFVVSKIPALATFLGGVGKSAFDAVVKGHGEARDEVKKMAELTPDRTLKPKEVLALIDSKMKDATEVGPANFRPLIESRRKKLNV